MFHENFLHRLQSECRRFMHEDWGWFLLKAGILKSIFKSLNLMSKKLLMNFWVALKVKRKFLFMFINKKKLFQFYILTSIIFRGKIKFPKLFSTSKCFFLHSFASQLHCNMKINHWVFPFSRNRIDHHHYNEKFPLTFSHC